MRGRTPEKLVAALACRPLRAQARRMAAPATGALRSRQKLRTRREPALFFSLLAALCGTAALLGACARSPERPAEPASALRCRPQVLQPGDTLELTMRTPHGGYLGVIAPGDFWFFLISPQPQPNRASLMPAHTFRNVTRMALPVSSTKAMPWVHGYNDAMLVFRKPGQYKILVGENLSSHDYPVSSCTVKFVTAVRR
jgi:hypothetical protein